MTDDRDASGGSASAAATIAVVFGQALAPALDRSARTTVEYHNRKPRFVDEIKIALPPDVGERHHLLFSFYHVAADVRKLKKGGDTAVLVGQCAVPLLSGRSLLSGEPFSVPVATQLPPNYLAPDSLEQVRWIADGKPVFTMQARVESTVHTHEPTLAKFFAYAAANADAPASESEQSAAVKTRLASTMNALATVPLGDLVLHLAPLLGRLVELASSKSEKEDVRERAFFALLRVLDAATSFDEDGTAVVAPYVRGVYGHESLGGALVHEQLTRLLIRELRSGGDRLAEVSRASAPLLLMIYKAICVHAERNGSLREKRPRAERVSCAFADQLAELFTLVRTTVATRSRTTVTVAKRLNAAFGRFACQLLDVIDRSKLFQLVSKYVQLLDTERDNAVLSEFKLVFIDAIGAHGYFVALNAPLAYGSLPTLGSELWRRHFLAALQLAEVSAAFDLAKSQPERSHIALQAIDFTWFQLYRLANDGRYAHRLARTRIASLMFALLPLLADRVHMMTDWSVPVKRRASMCAIWLLANVDRAQLSHWWRGESAARRCGLLALLDMALTAFRLNELDNDGTPASPIAGAASDARTTKQMIESFYGQDPNRRRGVAGTAISPSSGAGQQVGSRVYSKAGGYRAWAKERTASTQQLGTPQSPLANSAVGGDAEDGAAAKQAIEHVYEKAAGNALVKRGGYRAWAAQKQLKASQGGDDDSGGSDSGGAALVALAASHELSRTDSITRGEQKAQRRLSRSLLDVTAEAPAASRRRRCGRPPLPPPLAATRSTTRRLADLVALHEVGLVCIDTRVAVHERLCERAARAEQHVSRAVHRRAVHARQAPAVDGAARGAARRDSRGGDRLWRRAVWRRVERAARRCAASWCC
jgi:hypothetical protein